VLRSRRDKHFNALLAALPADAQRQAHEAYELFKEDPHHGSLHFKRINTREPPIYSVRVGANYRAVGTLRGDTVIWFWIGTHETYNKPRFS